MRVGTSPERQLPSSGRLPPTRLLPLGRSGALAAFLLATPALAVVGGAEDGGPLSRSSVMVLSSRGGVCSGIVLAPDAVLTAGHCVSGGSQVRVHFREPDGSPALIEPAAVVVNGGYDAGAVKARRRSIDLALVRVSRPLPARFGAASLSGRAPAKGDDLALGGYGVARPGDGRSSGTFRATRLVASEPYGRSTLLVWAAAPTGVSAGACEGDSGGPIAGPDGSVAAVTSWAAGGGTGGCGSMSQGVLVAPQKAWIDAILASWGRTADWR